MSRVLFALLLTSPGTFAQTTIQVPQDQPTIGGAIAVAQNGDTVLVSPGTYLETIDFAGKAIAVRSIAGPSETTIDAEGGFSNNQIVVKFRSGEGRDSLLEGFTITGGYSGAFCETCRGVGINIRNSSPTIRDCIVRNNSSLGEAGGISIIDGAPLIQNCIIRDNHTTFDAPGILINNSTDDWAVIANCVAYN